MKKYLEDIAPTYQLCSICKSRMIYPDKYSYRLECPLGNENSLAHTKIKALNKNIDNLKKSAIDMMNCFVVHTRLSGELPVECKNLNKAIEKLSK